MLDFLHNPITAMALLLSLVALFHWVKAGLGYRQVAADAESEYNYQKNENILGKKITRDMFVSAYKRANSPRANLFLASAITAILVLTYPIFMLFQIIFDWMWFASGRSEVIEPGFLVWKFMIFFGLIAVWSGIMFFTARQYHKNAPVNFQQELDKEREKALFG